MGRYKEHGQVVSFRIPTEIFKVIAAEATDKGSNISRVCRTSLVMAWSNRSTTIAGKQRELDTLNKEQEHHEKILMQKIEDAQTDLKAVQIKFSRRKDAIIEELQHMKQERDRLEEEHRKDIEQKAREALGEAHAILSRPTTTDDEETTDQQEPQTPPPTPTTPTTTTQPPKRTNNKKKSRKVNKK